MTEIIRSYSLYFNTREANSGNSNNCTFIFSTPIVLTNSNNRFLISTPMIELPYSFSQINSTNNNLPYSYSDSLSRSFNSTTMNIPEGNYNINQLCEQIVISLLLDILFYIPASTLAVGSFAVQYSSSLGIVTFFMSHTYSVTITLQFSLSYVLGIAFGFPQVNQTFGTAIKLTSPNKVQVNPITSVYIRSDNLKFMTNYEAIVDKYQNSDIVAKIPITNLPNSIIYYRNDVKSMINNKELSSLNLYISDNLSTSYTLNMNGVNYGIYIQLDEIMIKTTNAYKDKLENPTVAPPKELLEQRDDLLRSLIDKKNKLLQDIEDMKLKNKTEITNTEQVPNDNNVSI
jgi:hypothetical protein